MYWKQECLTYTNILKVPANVFDVNATVKRHPAASEKPAAARSNINASRKHLLNKCSKNDNKKSNLISKTICIRFLNQPALWMGIRQANTQKSRVSPTELTDKQMRMLSWMTRYPLWVLSWVTTVYCVQLTEMISALEMEGAMLLMNSEQVLWRGRGLGESSLGFFSSFFPPSAFSFLFSSSSF